MHWQDTYELISINCYVWKLVLFCSTWTSASRWEALKDTFPENLLTTEPLENSFAVTMATEQQPRIIDVNRHKEHPH